MLSGGVWGHQRHRDFRSARACRAPRAWA